MTQPAKSQEPTMEEILASIRRIIADDDATKPAPPKPEPAKAEAPAAPAAPFAAAPATAPRPRAEIEPRPAPEPPDQSSDILDLTEAMAAAPPRPQPPAPQFRTIDGTPDVGFEDQRFPSGGEDHRPGGEDRLLSGATSAAVDTAFNSLAQTVLMHNARTLEDLVREMLRPLLKSWLDDNLPAMVERLVRAEIERVSRGRAS